MDAPAGGARCLVCPTSGALAGKQVRQYWERRGSVWKIVVRVQGAFETRHQPSLSHACFIGAGGALFAPASFDSSGVASFASELGVAGYSID